MHNFFVTHIKKFAIMNLFTFYVQYKMHNMNNRYAIRDGAAYANN